MPANAADAKGRPTQSQRLKIATRNYQPEGALLLQADFGATMSGPLREPASIFSRMLSEQRTARVSPPMESEDDELTCEEKTLYFLGFELPSETRMELRPEMAACIHFLTALSVPLSIGAMASTEWSVSTGGFEFGLQHRYFTDASGKTMVTCSFVQRQSLIIAVFFDRKWNCLRAPRQRRGRERWLPSSWGCF